MTNEFKIPTKKTRKTHRAAPVKTTPFVLVQPSGDANTTGTAITIKNETAIRAKRASWNSKIIKLVRFIYEKTKKFQNTAPE